MTDTSSVRPTIDCSQGSHFDVDPQKLIDGLRARPKSIPSQYGYDAEGSRLWDRVTRRQQYYLMRVETEILQENVNDIIKKCGCDEIVELGSGSGVKTKILLDRLQQIAKLPVRYVPIDISRAAVEDSANGLIAEALNLVIQPIVGDYYSGLDWFQANRTVEVNGFGRSMFVFLGSTIGNMTHDAMLSLLSHIAGAARQDDQLLITADLRKERARLERAYNDSEGDDAFARFWLNRLDHINRLFDGNFEKSNFEGRGEVNADGSVELCLYSRIAHSVHLERLDFTVDFETGERVGIDFSRKFQASQIHEALAECGFETVREWRNREMPYLVVLARRV